MESSSKSRSKSKCKGKSKRRRKLSQSDEEEPAFLSSKYAKPPSSKIYNSRFKKNTPAELFRKDLISAMKLPDSEPLDPEDYWVIDDQWRPEWEKGVQVPVEPDALPEPNAVEIRKRDKNTHVRLPKKLMHFTRDNTYNPEIHSLCYTDKIAEETCRYDLDDVDIQWLNVVNEDRENFGLLPIEEYTVEKILETLEDMCHDNMQEAVQNESGLIISDEDAICDVCRSPDSEEGNEIVFCDACNVSVHQSCYGITQIPEGSWICRTCALDVQPSCELCPTKGGAMKPTRNGDKWCHVSCAIWIPEVSIGCVEKMEPITKLSQIPAFRWSLLCVLCEDKYGVCIQCSAKLCKVSYHVTCAFKSRLRMRAIMGSDEDDDALKLKSYCPKHTLKSEPADSDSEEVNRKELELNDEKFNSKENKKALEREANFNQYVSVDELAATARDYDRDILEAVFYYWVLKRKANFNQPLLRPREIRKAEDEAANGNCEYSVVKRVVKFRRDLERARNLCYMVNKREKFNRSWIKLKQDIFMKQQEILTDESLRLSKEERSAVLMANHGDLVYDKIHTGANSPSPVMLKILNTLIGEERTKIQLNGILKMRKKREANSLKKNSPNPYAKHYLNGLLKRSQRWLATVDRQKWENSESSQQIEVNENRDRYPSYTSTSKHVNDDRSEGDVNNLSHINSQNSSDNFEMFPAKDMYARKSVPATLPAPVVSSDCDDIGPNPESYNLNATDGIVSNLCTNDKSSNEGFTVITDANNLTSNVNEPVNSSKMHKNSKMRLGSGVVALSNSEKGICTDNRFNFSCAMLERKKRLRKSKWKHVTRTLFDEELSSSEESQSLKKVVSTGNCSQNSLKKQIAIYDKYSKPSPCLQSANEDDDYVQSSSQNELSEEPLSEQSDTDIYQLVANHSHIKKGRMLDACESVKENFSRYNKSGLSKAGNRGRVPMVVQSQKTISSESMVNELENKVMDKTDQMEEFNRFQHRRLTDNRKLCNGEKKGRLANALSVYAARKGSRHDEKMQVVCAINDTVDSDTNVNISKSYFSSSPEYSSADRCQTTCDDQSELTKNDKTEKPSPVRNTTVSEASPSSSVHSEKISSSATAPKKGSLTGYKIPKKIKSEIVEDESSSSSSSGLKRGHSPLSPLIEPSTSSSVAVTSSYSSSNNRYQRFDHNRSQDHRSKVTDGSKSCEKRNDHHNFISVPNHPNNHQLHHKVLSPHKVHPAHQYGIPNNIESHMPVCPPNKGLRLPPIPMPLNGHWNNQRSYHNEHKKEMHGVHWRHMSPPRPPTYYHGRFAGSDSRPWTRLRQPPSQNSHMNSRYVPGPPLI